MLDDSTDTISNPLMARPSRPSRSLFFSWHSSLFLSVFFSLCLSLFPYRPTLCTRRSSFFISISFAHRGLAARHSILRTIGLIGNRERDEDQAGQISRLILIGPLCCCYDRTSEQNTLAIAGDALDRCQFFDILEKLSHCSILIKGLRVKIKISQVRFSTIKKKRANFLKSFLLVSLL